MFAILLAMVTLAAEAEPVAVHNLRLWQAPDHTRLVLDLDGPLEHRLSTLKDPDRIVIELGNARLKDGLAPLDVSHSYLSAIRASDEADGPLRITLDLRRPVRPQSFVLKPFGQYGHRLVIDLFDEEAVEVAPTPEPRSAPPRRPMLQPPDLVVAIDAGHGGEDPGAIGRRYRTREKDVTLAIARELYKLVNATPGMKGVLTRDGDYFVALGKRRKKAERVNADVFVSIHADSLPGRRAQRVQGSSVYALSERGASSALAKALADDANASDWIGGMNPREVPRDLRVIMGDLAKDAAMIDGSRLGSDVLSGLRGVGPLHNDRVAQAGFAVLKQPIPAILVETAFISNATEEKKLRSPAHRRHVARGIYSGLKRAKPWILARRFNGETAVEATSAPTAVAQPVTRASREHIVRPGETLSAISRLYDVHIDVLRFLNGIEGNELAVGTRLRIPGRASDS